MWNEAPLAERIADPPLPFDASAVARGHAELADAIAINPVLHPLAELIARPQVKRLLVAVFGNSPYLAEIIRRQPESLLAALTGSPEGRLHALGQQLAEETAAVQSVAPALKPLRVYKTEAALVIGLADIAGALPILSVTAALSTVAETALQTAVAVLARRAAIAGDLLPQDPTHPEKSLGLIVLGMGKLGARELNYSSDIDLIVFYDLARVQLKPGLEPAPFFIRLTRDLIRLLQERTADGYVFRTDLRLRPDPGATQVALSTAAALHYYESFGQNWERAALIKARPVAGDVDAGNELLDALSPYIWRKFLDFAAIADIHAMKRQIHAFKGFGEIGIAGHNVKVGRGGIREIEFFVQTQQLIAGGRQLDLRVRETMVALQQLVKRGWIGAETASDLAACYKFLRMVEHRLQMIADEQTQTLPSDPEKLKQVALFSGFDGTASFSAKLREVLTTVQRHYGRLFEDLPELTSAGGDLVFVGDDDDAATLETLGRMGFSSAAGVVATVKGWHFGRYPAMRSARARELLTEFQPKLLEALSSTSEPDLALSTFDRFLSELPAGVQLFSMLRSNPSLARLLADIMGTAPRLAHILGRRSRLLDAVIDPGFFGEEPTPDDLDQRVRDELELARDYPDVLDRARIVGNEQSFLIGVRVLSGTIAGARAGGAYAALANALIDRLAAAVHREIARVHGVVEGSEFAVVAMGKLGGEEMTATSDLDLIVIYDFGDTAAFSNGSKPLAGPHYFSRLTQRLVTALTASTAEGRLYEVDMRLRPSGNSGPVATHINGFIDYQRQAAWTWEHMALTRARVLGPETPLKAKIERAISEVLTSPRDIGKLTGDVREMRERIAAEKGTIERWGLKQVRGGIVDLEFIAQFLQLKHAPEVPGVTSPNTLSALRKLQAAGLIDGGDFEVLADAARLYDVLSQIIRLCIDGPFVPANTPVGLKQLLCRAADELDFPRLEARLVETQARVLALYDRIVR